jgi:RNA polymerase sigma factor (sigma-70 family)
MIGCDELGFNGRHIRVHMDDGEVVAAIAAGDPGGLAAAYDTYAASLYGYCRWMLRDPRLAAEALRETFAGAARLGGLKDASQLRARLYAIARDDCYRRLRTAEPGFDEGDDGTFAGAASAAGAEQAVVRRVLRAILSELKPEEHEVIELSVRHGLDESELATVLEVSWSRAHTLASQAREHLEKAIDALLIARTGRQSCPELSVLLAGWDGKLTVQTGKVAAQHIETCEICAGSRHGSLRPEVLARLLPLPALPAGLREPVLERAASRSPSWTATAPLVPADGDSETSIDLIPAQSRERLAAAGPGLLRGGLRWDRVRGNPGAITAVAAVALWVVAAMSATLITVTGLHGTKALAAQSSSSATSPGSPAAGSSQPAGSSPGRLPSPSASTTIAPALAPTFAYTPTALPSKSATPATSAPATASASDSPSASPTDSSSPTPTPAPTHTRKPPPTPTPTPTPTDTTTDTPTPTPS